MSCEEHVVPIIIDIICVDTHFGRQVKYKQLYYNTLVLDPGQIQYISDPSNTDNYIRAMPVVRFKNEDVTWPEHPLNVNGKIQGAIIIIRSLDDKILLVRNGKLWGLPKGARNYTEFMNLKERTDNHFRETREILIHKEAIFSNDLIESAEDNACRETLEETGIIVDRALLQPIDSHYQINNYCAYDGFYYAYPKNTDDYYVDLLNNGTDHENDELSWVTIEELKQLLRDHRSHNRPKVFNHITHGFLDEYIKGTI